MIAAAPDVPENVPVSGHTGGATHSPALGVDRGQFRQLIERHPRPEPPSTLVSRARYNDAVSMFIGHFGVGFAAKRAWPRASLAVYIAAAELPDFLWAVFVLLGWEQVRIVPGDTAVTPLHFAHYPLSHSLLADAGWAAAGATLYWLWTRDARAALWAAGLVLSHWLLDVLSHRPDVPLAPGHPLVVGLGLWNSRVATVLGEGAIFGGGVVLYMQATRARDRTGDYALVGLAALLVLLYAGSVFGPPPPSVPTVAVTNLGGMLFVLWAGWIDRHRRTM